MQKDDARGGGMSVELFPMEQDIIEALLRAAKQLDNAGKWDNDHDKEWTLKLKEELRDLGHKKGYLVRATFTNDKPETDNQGKNLSEWLWDLAWLKCGDADWRCMSGVSLASEIEWRNDTVSMLTDFLKLTVCKADWRLFVFTLKKGQTEQDRQFTLLRKACPGSQGNRYLAVGFPERPPLKDVKFQAWTL